MGLVFNPLFASGLQFTGSGGGGSGANTTLSNLTAPTALNEPLLEQDGSSSAPSYSFTSDPTTGFYKIDANDVGLSIGSHQDFIFYNYSIGPYLGGVYIANGFVGGFVASPNGTASIGGNPQQGNTFYAESDLYAPGLGLYATSGNDSTINLYSSNGTIASPSATTSGHLGQVVFNGYDSVNFAEGGALWAYAGDTWSNTGTSYSPMTIGLRIHNPTNFASAYHDGFILQTDGNMYIGAIPNSDPTNLVWSTDNNFVNGGDIGSTDGGSTLLRPRNLYLGSNAYIGGYLGIGNSASASVAVGPLAAQFAIYDASGNLLGYVPIYSSIT